jgi:hypothetical protein
VTICTGELHANGDCIRSSHGVLAQARRSHIPSILTQESQSPETETANCSLTSQRLFLFLFLTSRSFPSPLVHTLPHISVIPTPPNIAITIPVPLTLSLRLQLPRSSLLSPLLRPFSLLLSPRSFFPPSSSISPFFLFKLTSHSHKGHPPSYYRSGTAPIRIRLTAPFLIQPPPVLPCLDGLSRARWIL